VKEIREIKGFVRDFWKESFTDALTNEKIFKVILRVDQCIDLSVDKYQDIYHKSFFFGKKLKTQEEFDLEPDIKKPTYEITFEFFTWLDKVPITIAEIERDDSINCYHELDSGREGQYYLKANYFIVKEVGNAIPLKESE